METSSGSSTSSNPPGSRASRSKSSGSDSRGLSPLALSAGLHLGLASVLAAVLTFGHGAPEKIEIDVITKPVEAPPQLNLAEQKKPEPRPIEPVRKVFGVTKNSLVSDEPGAGVAVKAGNTLATAPDNLKLKDSDAAALPIPTDEYLVTKMPSVEADVRVPYPPEAKAKKIEGKVVLDLLIDAAGRVRDAKLISGLGYGLDEAALNAIAQFKFHPAEVDGRPVAVRIPFTYHFLLKSE